jgi:4'-phosphopantetheinyl transferase
MIAVMNNVTVTCTAREDVLWKAWSAEALGNELAVYRINLTDAMPWLSQLRDLLTWDEIERALRYRRADDELRFSCTRALLRLLLARYTHNLPRQIQFIAGTHRKPALEGPTDWQFNVSHSGNWLLIAIGRDQVGVDLEWINPNFLFGDVLELSFSRAEQLHIESDADARLGFYRLWTRKEALVKATGKGMDDEFDRIPSLTGTHHTTSQVMGQEGSWLVISFSVADDYLAAIAHNGLLSTMPQFYTIDPGWLLNTA